MIESAEIEYGKREKYINPWFKQHQKSVKDNHITGFVGEFAFCEYLGVDWRENIRKSYITPDEYDLHYKGHRIDIKTETLKEKYATEDRIKQICRRTIGENEPYGCRLINENQFKLLEKYDIIAWGLLDKRNLNDWVWCPIGWSFSSKIRRLPIVKTSPNGKINYPTNVIRVGPNFLNDPSLLVEFKD